MRGRLRLLGHQQLLGPAASAVHDSLVPRLLCGSEAATLQLHSFCIFLSAWAAWISSHASAAHLLCNGSLYRSYLVAHSLYIPCSSLQLQQHDGDALSARAASCPT